MALALKILATGLLPNAKTTLYTVPGATSALVMLIVVVNPSGSTLKFNLYTKQSAGTSRHVTQAAQDLDTERRIPGPITLATADQIEGDDNGGGGASLHYTIFGVEKT